MKKVFVAKFINALLIFLDLMKNYISQVRQEIAIRLPERIYAATYPDTLGGKKPSKVHTLFI